MPRNACGREGVPRGGFAGILLAGALVFGPCLACLAAGQPDTETGTETGTGTGAGKAIQLEDRRRDVPGTLETRRGSVTWSASGGDDMDAVPRQDLPAGSTLKTHALSRASVRFRDGTLMRLDQLTRLEIVVPGSLGAGSSGSGRGIRLHHGEVLVTTGGGRDPMAIGVSGVTAVPRGTEYLVRADEAQGRAEFVVLDGEMEVSTGAATQIVPAGHVGVVEPGRPLVVRPVLQAVNLMQWWIDYPAILDPDELGLVGAERSLLAKSLEAYRRGDYRAAAREYPGFPEPAPPATESIRRYQVAVFLAVGAMDRVQELVAGSGEPGHPGMRAIRVLAGALESPALPGLLKGASLPVPATRVPESASEWLAASYLRQSERNLALAREAAWKATQVSPGFGPGWVRLAELEFALGRGGEARAAVERALGLSPDHAAAHAVRGFLLASESRFREAAAAFERARALDPELGLAWLGRGLVRRRTSMQWFGRMDDVGRLDLERAAALELGRAPFRSYLGRMLLDTGEVERGLRDLRYAGALDPGDPTPGVHAALGLEREGRVNEAVVELERAMRLGANRALHRSAFLLDQDAAVRGANLARMYRDSGMARVALGEAAGAVESDYSLGVGHLFLANAYQLRRDPNQAGLRYETPWLSEYLVATLLSPVDSGVLSPAVSSQEYSSLFARNRVGFVGESQYLSRGAWRNAGSVYGWVDRGAYAVEGFHRTDPGEHPNGDVEQSSYSARFKHQVTAADRVLLQVTTAESEFGDVLRRPEGAGVHESFRGTDRQEPLVLAALDHEWRPGSHTLLLAGRLHDRSSYRDPEGARPLAQVGAGGGILAVEPDAARSEIFSSSEFSGVTAEVQQIWQTERQHLVAGVRAQGLTLDQETEQGGATIDHLFGTRRLKIPGQEGSLSEPFRRWSAYAYESFALAPWLRLSAGGAYDAIERPTDPFAAPARPGRVAVDQWSPKAGLVVEPWEGGRMRAAFSRSLNGMSLDQSFRLEPAHIAGIEQAYRSVVPETVAGSVAGESVQVLGVALEQRLGVSGTHLTLDLGQIESEGTRESGWTTVDLGRSPFEFGTRFLPERLDYRERYARAGVFQRLGASLSVSAAYEITDADLDISADLPRTSPHLESTTGELLLQARVNHRSGFLSAFEADWVHPLGDGQPSGITGDPFWQFNLHAGWRFSQRRVEVVAGILNLTDTDYSLHPLVLQTDRARGRTATLSVRVAF